MKKLLTTAAFAATMALGAGLASTANAAVEYRANFNVTAYGGSSGLDIETSKDASGNPNIDVFLTGSSGAASHTTFDLFDIWTDEVQAAGDDLNHQPINVHFTFTAPGAIGGDVSGDTFGLNGSINEGKVTWDGPLVLNFGATTLTITLSDETFNANTSEGNCGDDLHGSCLHAGEGYDADVQATFQQTLNAVGGVPEPASWALMIGGFGMAGSMLRRRRTAMAATA